MNINFKKFKTRLFLAIIFFIGFSIFLSSCKKDEIVHPHPCLNENCEAYYEIDPQVSPDVYEDVNSYWHIKYRGIQYFTIMGELSELNPHYVINKVPLIEVKYDSDYWIAFGSLSFKIPIYSVLSWFTNGDWDNLIPVGDIEYTLTDIAALQPPLNIAGYQIQKNFCWECPYASSLIGSYSKYNYSPRQMFFLDSLMTGDTLKVLIETIFNNDAGNRVVIDDVFDIIVDE